MAKKKKKLSASDFEKSRHIANLMRSIFSEIEEFMNQIISDNFDKEIIDNLYSKIQLPVGKFIVNIELFNALTNTIVVFDMPLFELLQLCVSDSVEPLMNDKVPKMVKKSQQYKKTDNTNRVYLEQSI